MGVVDGGGYGGAIAGLIGSGEGAFPGGFAGEFIEGEEGCGGSAGATDDEVIDDEGGFGVGPGTGFAVVLGGEVGGPEDFAGGLFEAGEVAVGAQGVEVGAIERGGGACGGVAGALVGFADFTDRGGPEFFTGLVGEGDDELVIGSVIAESEDMVRGDDGAGVAGTDIGVLPEGFGAFLGP